MGEENKSIPFGNLTLGMFTDGTFVPLGGIVKDSLTFESEDEVEDTPDDAIYSRVTPSTFTLNASVKDCKGLDEIVKPFKLEPTYRTVVFDSAEYIHRPKNLKYPNKKRAKRIWKKWKRRFGYKPHTTFTIPKARFEHKIDENGNFNVTITAEPPQ